MDLPMLFMALISLLLLVLLFSTAGLAFMVLDKVPLHKVLAQRKNKELLRHEVYRYRLSKMLEFLGIRVDSYFRQIPEEEIRKHIIRCRTCPSVSICDRCLQDNETMKNMYFCPNYGSLLAYSKSISD